MSSNQTSADVQATLNYTLPSPNGDPLYSHVLRPDPPEPWTNAIADPRTVVIQDVRGREDEFSLDRSGFEFLRHRSIVTDFFDERIIKGLYYPEVQQLLRRHTSAGLVIITGHTLRYINEYIYIIANFFPSNFTFRRSQRGRQGDFTNVSGPAVSLILLTMCRGMVVLTVFSALCPRGSVI